MLEWTHDRTTCPAGAACPVLDDEGDNRCTHFPTVADRVAMAQAAYDAYAEADGTSFDDFVTDVALLMLFCTRELPDPKPTKYWIERWTQALLDLGQNPLEELRKLAKEISGPV